MIKVLRITKALAKFDVRYIMDQIKKFAKYKIEYDIDNNPLLGEDTISDNNNIEFLMRVSNVLKILKLVMIILNTSYFVGILFMIYAEVTMTIAKALGHTDQDFYIDYFDTNS